MRSILVKIWPKFKRGQSICCPPPPLIFQVGPWPLAPPIPPPMAMSSKRPGVRFGRGRGREQNTFPGAGAGGVAGNYRPGSPYLAGAGAGNGDKPSPGAGNSRRRESRSFPGYVYIFSVSYSSKSGGQIHEFSSQNSEFGSQIIKHATHKIGRNSIPN